MRISLGFPTRRVAAIGSRTLLQPGHERFERGGPLLATLADDTGVWRLAEGGEKLEDATPDAPGAFARCGKCAS
jgi:hypothetical protein